MCGVNAVKEKGFPQNMDVEGFRQWDKEGLGCYISLISSNWVTSHKNIFLKENLEIAVINCLKIVYLVVQQLRNNRLSRDPYFNKQYRTFENIILMWLAVSLLSRSVTELCSSTVMLLLSNPQGIEEFLKKDKSFGEQGRDYPFSLLKLR